MLPLVINEGTKYAQYISSSHKAYEVTIQFGLSSDTYDIEGEITKKRNIGHLSKELYQSIPHTINRKNISATTKVFSNQSKWPTRLFL